MSETNGNGRDPMTGRALAGNRLSVGNKGANPVARRMNELRKVLTDAATDDDIRDIYRSMLAAAKAGDVQAGRLLFDHLIGKPKERVEISGAEGGAIDLATIVGVIAEVIGDDDATRSRLAAAFARLGRAGDGV